MHNVVVSLIRTVVPTLVAVFITYLAKWGIDLDPSELNAWLIPALTAAYYALFRVIETRFPKLGWFLGYAKAPEYIGPAGQPAPSNR